MVGRLSRMLLAVALVLATAGAGDPASRVDVFAGTDAGAPDFGTGGGAGNTFPGAVLPFGMVQLSPDTLPGEGAFGGGYTYSDSRIKGFSLRHMSGPGCAAYQDFPITPTTAPIASSPAKPLTTDLDDAYVARFSHATERGAPGYYGVRLAQPGGGAIGAQLTATTRTGAVRFEFPRSRSASVLINASGSAMGASDATVRIDPARREISGSVTSGQFCYQRNSYRLHFVARFDRPFAAYGTWRGPLVLQPGARASGDSIGGPPFVYQPIPGGPSGAKDGGLTAQTGAYATFDARARREVGVRVGISSVSVAGARANLRRESDGRGFAVLRARARRAWSAMLGRLDARGGSPRQLRLFYTQLYHALIQPSTFSDADGRYSGFDRGVHRARGRRQYADFSGWDTYRTQMPLVAMIAPRRASDMVRSLLADASQSGFLPKWSQANGHTHVMTGDPADPLIAGAWEFGARRFDGRAALRAMVRGATRYERADGDPPYYERPGLREYMRLGYVPHELNTDTTGQTFFPEKVWGTAATTLEYALADFAIARMAAARCDLATARRFMRRSANWRNVFDRASRYVQPRNADGSFKRVGAGSEEGFVEGNAAQYTLFVPHDAAGLFRALGGRGAALKRLDRFFERINAGPDEPHAFLGNEPTLSTPWLFTWLGRPYRAAAIVRRAMESLYTTRPGGYPGNDDLGSMSSWWVFGALGIYPAVPGTDLLTVGSPLFRRVVLRLPRGRVVLRASGAGRYVRALSLDGHQRGRAWLHFARLRRGARLQFRLARRPARRFGSGHPPPSFSPHRPALPRSCSRRGS
ncbi:MAG: GH92 family glycosyl hydrolase [Thermoleophilaceae bacterium]